MHTPLLANRLGRWLTALLALVALLGSSATRAQSTANYTFTASSTGSLADMSSGTIDALTAATYHDDVASTVLPIGFTFGFMGTNYTQFSVNSNGQLRLGSTVISGGQATPTSGQAILAPMGGDNSIQVTGRLHYRLLAGTNRTLVVEWNSLRMPFSSTAGTGSVVQAILEENTGKVEYRYGAVFNNSTSALTRSIFISAGSNAGQIGVVTNYIATPTYDATATTATTTSMPASAAVPVLSSTADGSRTVFAFTPVQTGTPTTPAVTTTAITQTGMTLVITDNSTNETFFSVSRSTDNVTFTPVGSVAASAFTGTGSTVNFVQTGLTAGTAYFFRVTANNEGGGTSGNATATATTLAPVAICGTKTVGPGTGADYPTLTAALSAVAINGVCGPLVLELQSSYVSTTETFPLVYSAAAGVSAANTVTIRPAAGATGLVISSAGLQTLNLNGGRHLVLDGRPGGSGTTVSGATNPATDLVVANTSTAGQVIQFTGDASFNTVQHCQVKGVGTSLFSAPNISFSSAATAGNSDNVIRFNNIGDGATLPYGLVYSNGSLNARNTVTDNNLFNYYGANSNTAAAVYLGNAGSNWVLANNSIYQTTARTPTAATHYGLYAASGNGHTVTGNYIGGSAPLAGGTPHTVTGTVAAYRFVGIFLNTSGAATSVQDNTIANISWLSSSGATTTNGVLSGIYVGSGDANIGTVTGNTVGTAAGPITVSISTAAGYSFGISTASFGTVVIAKNTISNLSTSGSTATTASNVAGINLGNGSASIVTQNKLYALTAASGGASLSNGILITGGGGTNVNNNLIGGITAPTSTSLAAVSGIQLTGGTTSVSFNTIRLDGTSSGATFGTQGIYLNSLTASVTLFNNIVVNLSTPVGTGGAAAAIRRISGTAATIPSNLFGNNNLYYAGAPSATNLIYVEGTATQTNAIQTLAAYKALLVNREINSVTENNTPFASTTGTDATFLHLTAGAATQAESAGQAVAGVTTDFDGDVRNTGTPDIGADEGSFLLLDQTGPVIAITALGGTAGNTTSRPLTATITDASGVATGTDAARLYFRKGSTGAFVTAAAPAVAGSAYTFTFDYSLIGGVVAGDVINYYLAAQDALGNLSTNPNGGAGTTPPGTTPPSLFYGYTIRPTLSGTYYVSATAATSPVPARTYATLTAAVSTYNTADLAGPVTFLLLDPTYSTAETFPIAILNNTQASATNTLTLKPSNATGTTSFAITGSAASAVLQLLASDYVTIDGSLGNPISATDPRPSRDLTVANTSTATTSNVIQQFAQFTNDGATFNTVKNLVAVGTTTAATAATLYGIQLQGPSNATTANQYTNNTVQNCAVRGTQIGIGSLGGSATLKTQNTVITQNDLNTVGTGALTRAGIVANFDNNIQITQNAIDGITFAGSADVVGISLGFGLALGNTTFTGSEVTNATVTGNRIGSVQQTNTYSAGGIAVAAATSGTTLIANNLISGVSANGTGTDFGAGIFVGGGAGSTTNIYYNSVSMTGTQTGGSQPSLALAIGGTTPTVAIRNNVLVNTQSTGNNSIALGFAYSGPVGSYANLTSGNNAFFVGTGPIFAVGTTGGLGSTGTLRTTLADLNTETGQDRPATATGPVGTSLSLSASPFVSATDLHIAPATGAALNRAATPIAGITTDVDNDARNASTPDIGGDEFVANLDISVAALTAPVANSTCFGTAEAVTASITNAAPATLDFALNPVTVTVTITPTAAGGTAQTFTTTVSTGTLAAGASQAVTFTGTANLSVLGTYTATVTTALVGDDSPANNTLSPAVTITSGSRSAAFTYPAATICAGASGTVAATLGTGATAGTFASTTGLTINATTGAITPGSSTAGTYTVTNTLPATATCPATVVNQSVIITPNTSATFSYGSATFCVSGSTNPAATVTGTAGGTFASTTGLTINATTGAITLSSSTPNTYVVTYSVAGLCPSSSTQSVTITAAPTAAFSYAATGNCAGSATPAVPTLGTAGTFTSTAGLTINATTGAINLATSAAGTYTVTNTVAASGGCGAATAIATYIVAPRPATPTMSATYNGAITTLTSSAATGNQFFLNGVAITGATSQTYVVNGTPAQLGAYTVTTTNAAGCVSLPSASIVVSGTKNGIAGTSLRVYPNPTPTGQVTLELTGFRRATQLTVLDPLGRVISSEVLPAAAGTATHTLNLTGVASGVYLLRLSNPDGVETRRLVRE